MSGLRKALLERYAAGGTVRKYGYGGDVDGGADEGVGGGSGYSESDWGEYSGSDMGGAGLGSSMDGVGFGGGDSGDRASGLDFNGIAADTSVNWGDAFQGATLPDSLSSDYLGGAYDSFADSNGGDLVGGRMSATGPSWSDFGGLTLSGELPGGLDYQGSGLGRAATSGLDFAPDDLAAPPEVSGPPRGPTEGTLNAIARASTLDNLMQGIMDIESFGGKYDAVGKKDPRTGDRAYGAFQIMGDNLPSWTDKYHGERLSPKEFLRNEEAQRAVARGELGRLMDKHGPVGAAQAWYAGETGMKNKAGTDVHGRLDVTDYGNIIAEHLGLAGSPKAPGLPETAPTPPARPEGPVGPHMWEGDPLASGRIASLEQGHLPGISYGNQDRLNASVMGELTGPQAQALADMADKVGRERNPGAARAASAPAATETAARSPNAFSDLSFSLATGSLDPAMDFDLADLGGGLRSQGPSVPSTEPAPVNLSDVRQGLTEQQAIERAGLQNQRPSENVEIRRDSLGWGDNIDAAVAVEAIRDKAADRIANGIAGRTGPIGAEIDPNTPSLPDDFQYQGLGDLVATILAPQTFDYGEITKGTYNEPQAPAKAQDRVTERTDLPAGTYDRNAAARATMPEINAQPSTGARPEAPAAPGNAIAEAIADFFGNDRRNPTQTASAPAKAMSQNDFDAAFQAEKAPGSMTAYGNPPAVSIPTVAAVPEMSPEEEAAAPNRAQPGTQVATNAVVASGSPSAASARPESPRAAAPSTGRAAASGEVYSPTMPGMAPGMTSYPERGVINQPSTAFHEKVAERLGAGAGRMAGSAMTGGLFGLADMASGALGGPSLGGFFANSTPGMDLSRGWEEPGDRPPESPKATTSTVKEPEKPADKPKSTGSSGRAQVDSSFGRTYLGPPKNPLTYGYGNERTYFRYNRGGYVDCPDVKKSPARGGAPLTGALSRAKAKKRMA